MDFKQTVKQKNAYPERIFLRLLHEYYGSIDRVKEGKILELLCVMHIIDICWWEDENILFRNFLSREGSRYRHREEFKNYDIVLSDVINVATCDNRVCPQIGPWLRFYKMLPNQRRLDNGWEPPLPLVLSAWHYSTDSEKKEVFQRQIIWAFKQGVLAKVHRYLISLEEKDWLYKKKTGLLLDD